MVAVVVWVRTCVCVCVRGGTVTCVRARVRACVRGGTVTSISKPAFISLGKMILNLK